MLYEVITGPGMQTNQVQVGGQLSQLGDQREGLGDAEPMAGGDAHDLLQGVRTQMGGAARGLVERHGIQQNHPASPLQLLHQPAARPVQLDQLAGRQPLAREVVDSQPGQLIGAEGGTEPSGCG